MRFCERINNERQSQKRQQRQIINQFWVCVKKRQSGRGPVGENSHGSRASCECISGEEDSYGLRNNVWSRRRPTEIVVIGTPTYSSTASI